MVHSADNAQVQAEPGFVDMLGNAVENLLNRFPQPGSWGTDGDSGNQQDTTYANPTANPSGDCGTDTIALDHSPLVAPPPVGDHATRVHAGASGSMDMGGVVFGTAYVRYFVCHYKYVPPETPRAFRTHTGSREMPMARGDVLRVFGSADQDGWCHAQLLTGALAGQHGVVPANNISEVVPPLQDGASGSHSPGAGDDLMSWLGMTESPSPPRETHTMARALPVQDAAASHAGAASAPQAAAEHHMYTPMPRHTPFPNALPRHTSGEPHATPHGTSLPRDGGCSSAQHRWFEHATMAAVVPAAAGDGAVNGMMPLDLFQLLHAPDIVTRCLPPMATGFDSVNLQDPILSPAGPAANPSCGVTRPVTNHPMAPPPAAVPAASGHPALGTAGRGSLEAGNAKTKQSRVPAGKKPAARPRAKAIRRAKRTWSLRCCPRAACGVTH